MALAMTYEVEIESRMLLELRGKLAGKDIQK
jgi:hypothetical protein